MRVAQSALAGCGETRNILIVMVTGLDEGKDRVRALKAYHDGTQSQRVGLMAEVAELSLGDQVLSDMAILFADIRSFTALSEKMTPRDNFPFLDSYLGRMDPFIWEIGDAIMALFPSGAGSALDAAIAMLAHVLEYNSQRAAFGYAPISIGVGVNTGSVMLGVIGHERFMQGTVISDAVNLASRLEGLTKIYGASLVVSNHVLFGLEDLNRYHYRFLDRVRLKGKEDTVPVYEYHAGDSMRGEAIR